MSESESGYDLRTSRQREQYPELQVDSPQGLFDVDSYRRKIGRSLSTLGQQAEDLFVRIGTEMYDAPMTVVQGLRSYPERLGRPGTVGTLFPQAHLVKTALTPIAGEGEGARGALFAEATRPINYLPAGAGASALRTAVSGVGSALLGRGAKSATIDLTGSKALGEVAGLAGGLAGGVAGLKAGVGRASSAVERQGGPVVDKLIDLVNAAKPFERETRQLYRAERAVRAGKAAGVLGSETGEAAFQRAKGELGGALPRAQFTAPRPEFSTDEVTFLFETVRTHPKLRTFDRITAADALTSALAGEVPTRSEIALLEKTFGTDLAKALQSRRGTSAKAKELAGELLQLPRALQSSWDASAPFRQGIILSAAHPISSARATGAMIRAFASEKGAEAVDDAIRASRHAPDAERAGLYRAPLFGDFSRMTDREEAFMGNLAERLPIIGAGVRASERGYVTYLNKLRDDVFGNVVDGWDETYRASDENVQRLGKFINAATGRGDLGWLAEHAPTLNAAFFSPRYLTSRVQVNWQGLKAATDIGKSAVLRQEFDPVSKQIAGDLAKFYGTGITMLGLLKASDVADVDMDPRSSDFGKVRIGSTRYDFWGGNQQIARYMANLVSGEKKSVTTGSVYDVPRKQVVLDFLRSKLAPVPGLATDVAVGRTAIGDEVDLTGGALSTQAWNRLVPFFIHDLTEAVADDGLVGGFRALPSGVGVGYQRFGEERVPLDEKSMELFGKPYAELPRSAQRNIEGALPDVMRKITDDQIKRGGVSGARAQVRVDQQAELQGIESNLDGKALRARVGEIELRARSRRDQIDRDYGSAEVKNRSAEEQALDAYYSAPVKLPDGSIDWEATDEARARLSASWTPAQQEYVDTETGATDPNLPPRVRELKQTSKELDSGGFFDLKNAAWAEFKARDSRTAGLPDDYWKWREAEVEDLTRQGVEYGYAPDQSRALARDKVAGYKAVTAFNEFYRKEHRHQWVVDNPDLANRAWRYGYIDPDKQETAFLLNYGSPNAQR